MCTVGQEEIVTALEVSPDESTVPRDIFTHLYNVYEEAGKGMVVLHCSVFICGGRVGWGCILLDRRKL